MKPPIPALVFVCFAVASCGLIPEKVSINDPRIKPMLEAIARADRKVHGFTPVTGDATIRVELRARAGYDAMLHVDGKTSRTIAFKSVGAGYEWIGEQEIFRGPRTYKTPDGEFQETITLNYDK